MNSRDAEVAYSTPKRSGRGWTYEEKTTMNFKRTLVSAVAGLTLMASLTTPMVMAEDEPSQATVNEAGDFTFALTGNPITFTAVEVTTSEGATATPINRGLEFTDTHAYNPTGYNLQLTASDLEDESGTYTIDNDNLFVRKVSPGSGATFCPANTQPVVGNNDFQEVTIKIVHPGGGGDPGVPMSGAIDVVSATEGRGCGENSIGFRYTLNIPAGTYTGGGTAVYTGNITVSNTLAEPSDESAQDD